MSLTGTTRQSYEGDRRSADAVRDADIGDELLVDDTRCEVVAVSDVDDSVIVEEIDGSDTIALQAHESVVEQRWQFMDDWLARGSADVVRYPQ